MPTLPDSRPSRRPSARETGVMPARVPLFHIEPYQLDGENITQEMERASKDKTLLFIYFCQESRAYGVVLPQVGVPNKTIKDLNTLTGSLLDAIINNGGIGYKAYIKNRNNFFAGLRSSGNYSKGLIKILQLSEQSNRGETLIARIESEEFAAQVNKGNVHIPRVTGKVQKFWMTRDEISSEEGSFAWMNERQQRYEDLQTAIELQILTKYQDTP
jgi:hypothetical protein